MRNETISHCLTLRKDGRFQQFICISGGSKFFTKIINLRSSWDFVVLFIFIRFVSFVSMFENNLKQFMLCYYFCYRPIFIYIFLFQFILN